MTPLSSLGYILLPGDVFWSFLFLFFSLPFSFFPITGISCCPKSVDSNAKSQPKSENLSWSLRIPALRMSGSLGLQMTIKVKDHKHESNWKHYLVEPVCLPGHLAVYKTWRLARKLIARGSKESTGLPLRILHLLHSPNDLALFKELARTFYIFLI